MRIGVLFLLLAGLSPCSVGREYQRPDVVTPSAWRDTSTQAAAWPSSDWWVDAARVAAEVVEFYLPAAELKGVSLTARSRGPVQISGDPLLLAQAISNLIDNAVKYVPPQAAISVEVQRRADETVEIVVSDNGPGIGDAEKSKLTQRFYRGDASRGTPGVGLGLSLVEAVARLHGGAVEFADNHSGLSVTMTIEQGVG